MTDPSLQFLDVAASNVAPRRQIAFLRSTPIPASDKPGLVWLHGLKSEMTSTKASALADYAHRDRRAYVRFEYSGHGRSEGKFEDGRIGAWLDEAQAVLEQLTVGPQILVGSSTGGYLALLLLRRAIEQKLPLAERLHALVLIAPAWDIGDLIWNALPPSRKRAIETDGVYQRPSNYGDGPYAITRSFLDEANQHRLADRPLAPGRPVHILHGLQDEDVPWEHTLDLVAHLSGDAVRVEAVPEGDHRLSRPEDLALLWDHIQAVS